MPGLLLIGPHYDPVTMPRAPTRGLALSLVGVLLIDRPDHFVFVDLDRRLVRTADAHVAAQVFKHHVHFAGYGLLRARAVIVLLAEHLQAGVSERGKMHPVPVGRVHAGTDYA